MGSRLYNKQIFKSHLMFGIELLLNSINLDTILQ